MTNVELTRPPAFTRSGAPGEWIASRYDDARAILADDWFGVPEAGPPGPVGTVSWLRASVSRFVNGTEHRRRRGLAVAELLPLRPHQLHRAAWRRASTAIRQAARPGDRFDVMALLARRVPMAAMADALGISSAEDAADAVIRIARGYFPGADAAAERVADAATAQLVVMLGVDDTGPPPRRPRTGAMSAAPSAGLPSLPDASVLDQADLDVIVTRIALMVQGCDATAGLIGTALEFLQETADAAAWATPDVLDRVLWYRPVVRASVRVAREPVRVLGREVQAGDRVVCDVEAANADPAAGPRPDSAAHGVPATSGTRVTSVAPGVSGAPTPPGASDRAMSVSGAPTPPGASDRGTSGAAGVSGASPAPSGSGEPAPAGLTFGYGVRPCPGRPQALALATGVIDAVRDACSFVPGQPVEREPGQPLRIPRRLEVVVR